MGGKIRVLIVDDSFLMRRIISDIITSDPDLEVVGKAKNGVEAVEKALELKPDVMTLDINLPLKDGIDVLQELMAKRLTRVIMLSAYTRAGATATMKALELGAVDFIAKPSGEISLGLDQLKNEIIAKIKLASKIDLDKYLSSFPHLQNGEAGRSGAFKKLVVIGASTGGPRAVLDIMKDIPGDLPASFLIVQHMPKGFTLSFAERISWQSGVRTKEAEAGDKIARGKALVAPADFHMMFERPEGGDIVVKLTQDPQVNFVRPSIDVTMLSIADFFPGMDIIGVILTGLGRDGTEGARKIKANGGKIIVQDEKSSVVWGMPRSVVKEGLANQILPLSRIAGEIIRAVQGNGV